MKSLFVSIFCKPEKREVAKQFFESFVLKARSEKGCLKYDLLVDESDPNIFYFYELWESEEDFLNHSNESYLKEFKQRYDELLEKKNTVTFMNPLEP